MQPSKPSAEHIFVAGIGLGWLGIEGTLGGITEWQAGYIDGNTLTRTESKTDTTITARPVDVHFTTPTTGWMIVYEIPTKTYLLLLTTDGGNTWKIKASRQGRPLPHATQIKGHSIVRPLFCAAATPDHPGFGTYGSAIPSSAGGLLEGPSMC